MAVRIVLVVSAVMVYLAISSANALGQGVERYQPASPTLSPYLNFFRRDTGILPTYWQFVRPAQQVMSTFEQQQAELQFQQAEIRRLQLSASQGQGQQPTATRRRSPGGFQNFSHFYAAPQIPIRR